MHPSNAKQLLPFRLILVHLAVLTMLLAGVARATDGIGHNGLMQMLERQGWGAETAPDGSLIFRPPVRHSPQTIDFEPSKAVDREPPEHRDIRRLLLERGWRTETDAAGNTLLFPTPGNTQTRPPSGDSRKEPSAGSAETEPADRPFDRFQHALSSTGWQVQPNADGSMVIFPPARATPKAQHEHPVRNRNDADWRLLSSVVQGEIALPIDTASKAAGLATDWIANHGNSDQVPGRVRRVNRIYAISIVAREYPHRLQNQLIVRIEDGAVIAIY